MKILKGLVVAVVLMIGAGAAVAQTAPQVSTRKVDGTDNVYIFRYRGHQSIFIVTRSTGTG